MNRLLEPIPVPRRSICWSLSTRKSPSTRKNRHKVTRPHRGGDGCRRGAETETIEETEQLRGPVDEEPEVSEACEEEQEDSDEGAEAEWEELEDTADEAAEFEPELLESEVWSGTADQNAFRDRVLAAHIARSKAARGAAQLDLRSDELKTIPRNVHRDAGRHRGRGGPAARRGECGSRRCSEGRRCRCAANRPADRNERLPQQRVSTRSLAALLLRAGRLLRPNARRASGHSRRPPLRPGGCLPAEAKKGRRLWSRRADCRSRLQQSSRRHCGRLLPGADEGESHRQQVRRHLPATVAQHLVPPVVEDQRSDVRLCGDLDGRVALGIPPVGDIRCPSTGRALHPGPRLRAGAARAASGHAIRRARALRTTSAQRHRG